MISEILISSSTSSQSQRSRNFQVSPERRFVCKKEAAVSAESTRGRGQHSGFAGKCIKGANPLAFCPHLIGTASPPPHGHRGGSSIYLVGAEAAILWKLVQRAAFSHKAEV